MSTLLKHYRSKGFTIVELIIVIVVIGILVAISIVSYAGIQQSARDKALISDIDNTEAELVHYSTRNQGVYGSVLNWNSSVGDNANIHFSPSPGDVIVVTATDADYCIKAYNPVSNSKTLATAQTRESTPGACGFKWGSISTSSSHTCAISVDNRAFCWGNNSVGQLGNGTTTNSSVPVAVSTSGVLAGKPVKSISVGHNNETCVVATDNNQAYCWGYNLLGQLGNGTTTNSSVPVAVSTSGVLAGKTIKSISVGDYTTCVIASDNQAYCWGNNSLGQLGNGTVTTSSVPVAVSTSGVLAGKTLKSISVGNSSACVIASDNQVYCWGYNIYGQLGNGTTTNSSVPVAVSTSGVLAGKTLKSITVGAYTTCAIASDNHAYCWGYNNVSQFGDGTTTNSSVPVAVSTSGALSGKTIQSIGVGLYGACAIASDNQAYCWGYNVAGENGTNSTTPSTVPVAVLTSGVLAGKTIKSISVGHMYDTCAIASDGQAYCWGYNTVGQLGNGTTTNSLVPVLVTVPN